MRLQRQPARVSLLLAVTITSLAQLGAAAGQRGLVKRQLDVAGTQTTALAGSATVAAAALDKQDKPTKDAPVDGKDGMPHAGPWVETAAERDRKKAKEKGEEVPAAKKPIPGSSTNSDLPESNEGVMDDKSRTGPKDGQRGTEGGISEKTKEKSKQEALGGKAAEKTPDKPKEAPPLPHSEASKIKDGDKSVSKDDSKSKDAADKDSKMVKAPSKDVKDKSEDDLGLKKPADLPDKPHDIPHPVPIGSEKTDPLAITKPKTTTSTSTSSSSTTDDSLIQPFHSFVLSLTMILVSEIGDKTFLVAALMAMKHPPLFVFSAAYPALVVMTVGSAIMGHAAPMLLPPQLTNFAAAVLFLIFGARMLNEGRAMSPDEGVGEEMREVESELEEKEAEAAKFEHRRRNSNISPHLLEGGRKSARLPARADSPIGSPDGMRSRSPARSGLNGYLTGLQNLFSLLLSPAWVQTFVMTFLGEWGDRSQIATIAMAAGQNYWWVTVGALAGHCVCTGIAVIGGRAIAGRVSMRTVTLGGAIAFLVFGFIYLAEAFYYR